MTVIDIVQESVNKRLPSTSDQICSGYNDRILFHCDDIERGKCIRDGIRILSNILDEVFQRKQRTAETR